MHACGLNLWFMGTRTFVGWVSQKKKKTFVGWEKIRFFNTLHKVQTLEYANCCILWILVSFDNYWYDYLVGSWS